MEQNAIKYLEHAIRQDKVEDLERYLPLFDLAELPQAALDRLFVRLAGAATGYGATACMRALVRTWNDAYETGTLSYEAWVFCTLAVPTEVLAFLLSSAEDFDVHVIATQLVGQPDLPQVIGLRRLIEVAGAQTFDPSTVQSLLQKAKEEKLAEMEEVLGALYAQLQPELGVPGWLRTAPEGLLTTSEWMERVDAVADATLGVDVPPLSLDDAVEQALSGLAPEDPKRADHTAILRAAFQTMTDAERGLALWGAFMDAQAIQLADVELLNRVLGQANPVVGADLGNDHECSRYGGCRMLLCTCLEAQAEEDEFYERDWFTGVCRGCHQRIAHPWYAVRQPLPGGGWQGCYCSTRCIEPYTYDLMDTLLLQNVADFLETTGIYDRSE
jgi:hypothetical protein